MTETYTIQKLVIKDDKFYFIASPTLIFILFILFGLGFLGGAAKITITYGTIHWFYVCLTFGILGLVLSPRAFKFEYGFEWGAEEGGIKIRIENSNKSRLWHWDLVKEITLMNSHREYVASHGKSEYIITVKPIYFLIDQSNCQKTFMETAYDWFQGGAVDEFKMSFCGSTQEEMIALLQRYVPTHVKIKTFDKVGENRESAEEWQEPWLNQ